MSSHRLITLSECVLFIPAVSHIVSKLAGNPWKCSPVTGAFRAALQPSRRNSLKDLHILLGKSCSYGLAEKEQNRTDSQETPKK